MLDRETTWLVKMERHEGGGVKRFTVRVWAYSKVDAMNRAERENKGGAVSARVED